MRHTAKNKWTPLHCAAAAGDASACSILLDAGADIEAQVLGTNACPAGPIAPEQVLERQRTKHDKANACLFPIQRIKCLSTRAADPNAVTSLRSGAYGRYSTAHESKTDPSTVDLLQHPALAPAHPR